MNQLTTEEQNALQQLLDQWPQGSLGLKQALLELKEHAHAQAGAALAFISRPGVSHSFRFSLDPSPNGRKRPIFAMMDVVLAADEMFLSVCFFEDEITDPQELGDSIPGGLFNENGYCFDLDEPDGDMEGYLKKRLEEAYTAARG